MHSISPLILQFSLSPSVSAVLEGERPKNFFRQLLQADVKTFDFKWLRGVHRSNWYQFKDEFNADYFLCFRKISEMKPSSPWLLYPERGSQGPMWTMCTWVVAHQNFSLCKNIHQDEFELMMIKTHKKGGHHLDSPMLECSLEYGWWILIHNHSRWRICQI